MGSFWWKDGAIVVDGQGRPIWCDVCPCGCNEPECWWDACNPQQQLDDDLCVPTFFEISWRNWQNLDGGSTTCCAELNDWTFTVLNKAHWNYSYAIGFLGTAGGWDGGEQSWCFWSEINHEGAFNENLGWECEDSTLRDNPGCDMRRGSEPEGEPWDWRALRFVLGLKPNVSGGQLQSIDYRLHMDDRGLIDSANCDWHESTNVRFRWFGNSAAPDHDPWATVELTGQSGGNTWFCDDDEAIAIVTPRARPSRAESVYMSTIARRDTKCVHP